VLPTPFLLALAAAARARTLRHGAAPKVFYSTLPPTEIALHEIAADLLSEADFEFPSSCGRGVLVRPKPSSAGRPNVIAAVPCPPLRPHFA
jgi:hypothetical protein